MKMLAVFIASAAALLAGMALVIVGAAGSQWVDCPATLAQFPAAEMRCNMFSGFVFGGALMAITGGSVFSWIGMFGKWPGQPA